MFNIKKLFTGGISIGRFEYFKLTLGLLFIPLFFLLLIIIVSPDDILSYPVLLIAIVALLFYLIIFWTATYKRMANMFNNVFVAKALFLLIFLLSNVYFGLYFLFNFLLIVFPSKKESEKIYENKLCWITLPVSLILLTILILFGRFGVTKYILGKGMNDTLKDYDRIYVDIFDKEYHRGEIIVHELPNDKKVQVKRIIGLPKEKVEIKAFENNIKKIYVNGVALDEPYVKNGDKYPECSPKMRCEAISIPENHYYVLGEDRLISYDSRHFGYGTIDKKAIKGKVKYIWFPLARRQVFNIPEYD